MDDRRARLVVLLLRDPHLLEGREGGEDRAANCEHARSTRQSEGERSASTCEAMAKGRSGAGETVRRVLHTEYLRSGGAMILTFIDAGARAVISLDMRSAMPANMVVPPERTMLA